MNHGTLIANVERLQRTILVSSSILQLKKAFQYRFTQAQTHQIQIVNGTSFLFHIQIVCLAPIFEIVKYHLFCIQIQLIYTNSHPIVWNIQKKNNLK